MLISRAAIAALALTDGFDPAHGTWVLGDQPFGEVMGFLHEHCRGRQAVDHAPGAQLLGAIPVAGDPVTRISLARTVPTMLTKS